MIEFSRSNTVLGPIHYSVNVRSTGLYSKVCKYAIKKNKVTGLFEVSEWVNPTDWRQSGNYVEGKHPDCTSKTLKETIRKLSEKISKTR
jgi:signal recognition particle subunit SEC65